MTSIYLVLQADYENISLSLWKNTIHLTTKIVHKMHACQQLMPSMVQLLAEHSLNFKDLSCIVVNQGPAPFTTLRIVITTANALNFAHKTPLIGIDALQCFAQEFESKNGIFIIILNAFTQDAYFAIVNNERPQKPFETGCENNELLLQKLTARFPDQTLTFIGNGAEIFKENIKKYFKERALFLEQNPHYTNLEQTAKIGYQHWIAQEGLTDTLLPLYLKIQTYKMST